MLPSLEIIRILNYPNADSRHDLDPSLYGKDIAKLAGEVARRIAAPCKERSGPTMLRLLVFGNTIHNGGPRVRNDGYHNNQPWPSLWQGRNVYRALCFRITPRSNGDVRVCTSAKSKLPPD